MLDNNLYYDGKLGAIYENDKTTFILWAPTAEEVHVKLYDTDKVVPMCKGNEGEYIAILRGDLENVEYNYIVKINGKENIVVDPYAKAVSVNGTKGIVVNLELTNPEGFENDVKPEFKKPTDGIIYEMHVRDFTIDESSGVSDEYKGKFKGLCQSKQIEYLKELGVTHIHLLPIFDYKSIDETSFDHDKYNWGYDPQNYNVPEGSYSTNPYNGKIRVKEVKEMIMAMHKAGIRVIMDVVYNHTYDTETSLFNLAVPKYYHRTDSNGNFTNGSACGNEVASEKPMVRRFIKDSLIYWAKEYHIDGFRFDLMGLHDIKTMMEIREELNNLDKSILVYGEGWKGGQSALPEEELALKCNTTKFGREQIACFSDDIRDGIKGDVFNAKSPGFVNGGKDFEETIKAGVVGCTKHSQVDYSKVIYSDKYWANEPYQTITYASAHDNYTLWDKLQKTIPENVENREEKLIRMNKLVAAIVLTSQGISFIHSGEEIARTKVDKDGNLVENSYNSPDSTNKFDWNRKEKYKDIFNYYSGLIKLRKKYNEFRMTTSKEIQQNIHFFNNKEVVAYSISNKIIVIHNNNEFEAKVSIPEGKWDIVVNENKAGIDSIKIINSSEVIVRPISCMVLIRH